MKLRYLTIVLISCIVFTACGKAKKKETSHQEEVTYYVAMWTNYRHQMASWGIVQEKFNDLVWQSNNTEGEPLGDSLIRDFQSSVKTYITTVDSSLKAISTIEKIDNDFNLLENMTNNLNRSKKLWQENILKRADYFKTGLKNLSDKEVMQLESLEDDPDDDKLRKDWNSMESDITEFRQVHKITTEDLKQALGE